MPPKISLATVDTARQNLDALPAAAKDMREVGPAEVIRALTPTIRKLLGKGYSRQQVVDLLQEQGVPVTLSALKAHFRLQTARPAKPEGDGRSAAAAPTVPNGRPGAATETGSAVAAESAAPAAHVRPVLASQSRPAGPQRPTDRPGNAGDGAGTAGRPETNTS
jgi:hypothetical protein